MLNKNGYVNCSIFFDKDLKSQIQLQIMTQQVFAHMYVKMKRGTKKKY